MNYEEKYKNALERASKLRVQNPFDTVSQMMEHVFPELIESEDERIRKAIIDSINYIGISDALVATQQFFVDVSKGNMIAWLEKQGKQETICDKCRKEQPSHSCQDITELGRCAVEHEQKPADKAELKFKVGDWINGYYTNYKVTAINSEGYVVEDTEGNKLNILFENEKFHHLFTIADAKNDDVLMTNSNIIFIFKYLDEGGTIAFRASCTENSGVYFPKMKERLCDQDVYPASKEQRDFLFQKIREAGYEYNTENKEVKYIEQKPFLQKCLNIEYERGKKDAVAWSEEDEEMFKSLETLLNDASCYSCTKGADKILTWLKSIKQKIK